MKDSENGFDKGSKGRLFIVSAPSGTGKTTLCNAIRQQFPDLAYSVSYTTRAPRPGETDGVEYHFITRDAFRQAIEADQWAEWAEVHGNYYGTSAAALTRELHAGRDILLDIDVAGARQIKQHFADSIAIFIMPPSMEALENRLKSRASDSEADIRQRISNARAEMEQRHLYDHVIVNDRLDKAIDQLTRLIEHYRRKSATS